MSEWGDVDYTDVELECFADVTDDPISDALIRDEAIAMESKWDSMKIKEIVSDSYGYRRVPFGVISSPFLLAATIRHHLQTQNNAVSKEIRDNLYVDNVLIAAQDIFSGREKKTTFSIKENEHVEEGGELVGTFTPAHDSDASSKHRNICYSVVKPETTPFFFNDKKKPELFVRESLDREKQPFHELTISTFDCNDACNESGKASVSNTTVVVEVIDVNDNFPKFRERAFHGAAVQGRTQIGDVLLTVVAEDPDVEDSGLAYEIKGNIRRNSELIAVNDSPIYINSSTGDILSNSLFRMDVSTSLNFYVTVTDGAGHEDEALVTVTIISYEQQVELVFDASSKIISDQLAALQKFLSAATGLTAIIDTVFVRTNSTVIMAHFLDKKNSFVAVQDALRNLNRVELPSQQKAKQALFSKFGLRKAEPSMFANDDDSSFPETVGPIIYGLVTALVLLLCILTILSCRRKRRYFKKMHSVGAVNYSTAAVARTATRTKVHSTKGFQAPNPEWKDEKVENSNYPQQLIDTLQSTEL